MDRQHFHGRRTNRFTSRAAAAATAGAAVLAMALLVSACSGGPQDTETAPSVSALPDYSGSCGCNKAEKRKSYAKAMQEIHPDTQ